MQILTHSGKLKEISLPCVAGIINATPDSFACRLDDYSIATAKSAVEEMLREGADIIDVGGYSTRPDAGMVSEEEEWGRLENALKAVREISDDIILSVDTWRGEIARRAVEQYGADIINDVSGGLWDEQMFDIMVRVRACYILTHTRWQTPDRQLAPTSPDGVLSEVLHFLQERVDRLHQAGVNDVIIDPGFGFGKTLEENYILLREMKVLHTLHCPIMVGLSRKSMLYKALQTTPANALNATTAANMLALINGADILRVHDVKQAKETITIFKLCRTSR